MIIDVFSKGLERICACTSRGRMYFFSTTEDEDSTEEREESDDSNVATKSNCEETEETAPSTSMSSNVYQYVSWDIEDAGFMA